MVDVVRACSYAVSVTYRLLIKFTKRYSRKGLYEALLSAIDEHCAKPKRILSVGAGGAVGELLEQRGISFEDLDIDPKRGPDYACDIEDMSIIEDSSFDVILILEVLEHVKNPFNAVKEIDRVLKPGGIVIGSTPFIFPIHDEPDDYYRYTKYGVRNIFNGFRCLKLCERNSYIESVYVILIRLIVTGSIKQRAIGIGFLPIYLLMLPVTKIASYLVTNVEATTGYFFIFQKEEATALRVPAESYLVERQEQLYEEGPERTSVRE